MNNLFKNSIWTLLVHKQCNKVKEGSIVENFTRSLGEKGYNHSLSTSEAELTDVELAIASGGCGGGCYAGGGAFYGGPIYSGVVYCAPIYSGVIYGGSACGGPAYGGSSGCPQVIVVQQPDQSITPPPAETTPPPIVTPSV